MSETRTIRKRRGPVLAAVLTLALAPPALGQESDDTKRSTYRDAQGTEVVLPLGDLSFADRVVEFTQGTPSTEDTLALDPAGTLGPPDYDETEPTYATLGCGGSLVLAFEDNVLVDVPGDDIHVFEVGPDVEPTRLAISRDGESWLEVGEISGGTASADIGPLVTPEDAFRFIRVTDLRSSCGSRWPGADIDAVAAVGSAVRLTLRSTVLFAFDRHELRPEAAVELDRVVAAITEFAGARVIVQGHTDAVGSRAYNQVLSERRAQSVVSHLGRRLPDGFELRAVGFGESRPVASNETEEGRRENRRVEVAIVPAPNQGGDR